MANRFPLAHLPTPIHPLKRLTAQLGGPQILVKRDDQTGLAFGGNKTRKLEFLIADALSDGADTVFTTGAAQSNHCRQTAAAAAAAGLGCHLVLVGEEKTDPSGNLFLDQLLGAEISWTNLDQRDERLKDEFQKAKDQGNRPYLIPYGGSNVLGAASYYDAFVELIEQLGNQMPEWIVFASSSGGTQAGLVAGAICSQSQTKILGISVDESAAVLTKRVAALAEEVCAFFGNPHNITPPDIQVNDAYLGEGYGVFGTLEKEAIEIFAQQEGLLLDPVYTGRAAGGLMDLIKQQVFKKDQRILFWHTGGTPCLFADQYLAKLMEN